jgi:hypothetical protein
MSGKMISWIGPIIEAEVEAAFRAHHLIFKSTPSRKRNPEILADWRQDGSLVLRFYEPRKVQLIEVCQVDSDSGTTC